MTKQEFDTFLDLKAKENELMRAGKWKKDAPVAPVKQAANPPPAPVPPAPLAEATWDEKTFGALAKLTGFSVPKSATQEIAKLQKSRDVIFTNMEGLAAMRFGSYLANNIDREADALIASAEAGETGKSAGTLTRSCVTEEYTSRKRACRAALKKILLDAARIARPILEEFVSASRVYVDALEQSEKETAKKHCVRWEGSRTCFHLRCAIEKLAKIVPADGVLSFQNPAEFLPPFKK